jgi:hypothetical protein
MSIDQRENVQIIEKKSKFLLIITDYSYERLDGSVRGEERFIAVQNFNKNEDTLNVYITTFHSEYRK